jgi:hypothetical protein
VTKRQQFEKKAVLSTQANGLQLTKAVLRQMLAAAHLPTQTRKMILTSRYRIKNAAKRLQRVRTTSPEIITEEGGDGSESASSISRS